MTTQRGAILRLSGGLVLIGTVGAAVVATGLDAVTIVFWRSAIATLFLLCWCFATGILPDRTITRRNLVRGVIAGTSLVLSWAAFFAGIKLTSISTATVLVHMQPFLVLLIGMIIWREKVSGDQFFWIALAFMGMVFASGLALSRREMSPEWVFGVAITLLSAVLYAVTAIVGRGLSEQRGEVTTLCQTVVGVLVFAPFIDFHQTITLDAWGWLAVIGIVQTGVGWVLIYSGYPHVSTPMLAILSFLNPLTAILTDWVFFGHALNGIQWVGVVLIVGATMGIKLGWRLWPDKRQADCPVLETKLEQSH